LHLLISYLTDRTYTFVVKVYVGAQAIVQLQGKIPLQNSPAMDIFKQLVVSFDSEGRYHLFNAMANQLRYPNRSTPL
jgi:CCR4-NOT transcription complex subunit 1